MGAGAHHALPQLATGRGRRWRASSAPPEPIRWLPGGHSGRRLPYTFSSFQRDRVLTPPMRCTSEGRAQINPRSLAGSHRGHLPLNEQVINFGSDPSSRDHPDERKDQHGCK